VTADALFPVTAADVALTNDEWYTPRWLFRAAAITFDMDVCAPVAPEFRTCPARQFLTVLDDGLAVPWTGLIWCNPPYSNPLPWAHRLAGHPDWLALFPAAASPWRRVLLPAADGLTLITIDGNAMRAGRGFMRPDGTQASYPFALILAGRGGGVPALDRVARVDDHAAGAWFLSTATVTNRKLDK
jgi:DNA N-6-adenine-methyltransferase (Dam)